MRSVVVTEFGGTENITIVESATPEPGPGEVLVRVAAAALHPTDAMAFGGLYVQVGAAVESDQYGIGVDVAGTVESIGPGVTTVAVGDSVIGLEERTDRRSAGQADFVILDEWAVAPAPAGVSAAEAAGLPLNGLTAWQALHRLAVPPTGWLLVTGAAGAVGGLAVQLAKLQGLRVVAHARADDRDLVRRLGADLFVSTDEPIGPAVRALVPGGVDAALDAANLAIAAMDAVRHGGSYVSLLNRAPQARRDIESINLAYRTDRAQLGVLSALASAGAISTVVAREFPLDEARAAHEYRLAGGFRGLVVITA